MPASPLSLLCRTCRYFETLSYLPPLSDEAIAKQARAMLRVKEICGSESAGPDLPALSIKAHSSDSLRVNGH